MKVYQIVKLCPTDVGISVITKSIPISPLFGKREDAEKWAEKYDIVMEKHESSWDAYYTINEEEVL